MRSSGSTDFVTDTSELAAESTTMSFISDTGSSNMDSGVYTPLYAPPAPLPAQSVVVPSKLETSDFSTADYSERMRESSETSSDQPLSARRQEKRPEGDGAHDTGFL